VADGGRLVGDGGRFFGAVVRNQHDYDHDDRDYERSGACDRPGIDTAPAVSRGLFTGWRRTFTGPRWVPGRAAAGRRSAWRRWLCGAAARRSAWWRWLPAAAAGRRSARRRRVAGPAARGQGGIVGAACRSVVAICHPYLLSLLPTAALRRYDSLRARAESSATPRAGETPAARVRRRSER
jgi:hypothetical protein